MKDKSPYRSIRLHDAGLGSLDCGDERRVEKISFVHGIGGGGNPEFPFKLKT